jgi:phthalate 4,5-dioxygenase oxygenase subunit
VLSVEENDLLCRVGPGTVMGDLFRQYWLPAMLSSELPEPDGAQVRVKLLGEELIAFRDSGGDVGLVANLCPHRGASLFYARNEEGGLRCVYHGWKYDKAGKCVDMPSEPSESNFKDRIHLTAYPCVERHGLVWTYMGPRETPPPLPEIEANMLEGRDCRTAMTRDCNWMQALEGDIDTVHFSWLHVGHLQPEDAASDFLRYQTEDRHPKFGVVDTEWGTTYGAFISAGNDKSYLRMAHFLFPCYTMIPQGAVMENRMFRAWVPMDDTHTIWFSMSEPASTIGANQTAPGKSLAGRSTNAAPPVRRAGESVLPNSTDWYGRFNTNNPADRDYDLDRAAAKRLDSFTGLPSVTMEDHAVTESMGPVLDRTVEHLGTSDAMIIRTRNRLISAALAFREKGVVPPGVDEPTVYHQRSGGLIINDADRDNWFEVTAPARAAFVEHSEEELRASVTAS